MAVVYRTKRLEAPRLLAELARQGLAAEIEQYGTSFYVVIDSARPDLDQVVRSTRVSAVRVRSFNELFSAKS